MSRAQMSYSRVMTNRDADLVLGSLSKERGKRRWEMLGHALQCRFPANKEIEQLQD